MAAAVLALLFESGCVSVWAIQRPPSPPIDAKEPLECTRQVVAPVVDTGIALGLVVGLVAGWAGTSSEAAVVPFLATVILAGPTVLSALSAAAGFESTARCRELEEAMDQCLKGDRGACRKLGWVEGPPQGPSPAPAPPSSGP